MEHDFLDKYAGLPGLLQALDARVKALTTLVFILAVVLTPPAGYGRLPLYLLFLAALILSSRLPAGMVLKRSLVVLPFAVFVALFTPFTTPGNPVWSVGVFSHTITATDAGLLVFYGVSAKAWLSSLAVILLVSTTPFPRLLKALEDLGLPAVMASLLSFLYRYLFVLIDELHRIRRAVVSRGQPKDMRRSIALSGVMLGHLFIHGYERAERVYEAMASRGFDGVVRVLGKHRLRTRDLLYLITSSSYILGVALS